MRRQVGQNLLGGLRLLGEHQLEVMTKRGFDGRHIRIGDVDFVGQGAQDVLRLLQGGQRAGAEAFVARLELLQNVEPRPLFSLVLEHLVKLFGGGVQFLLDFAKPLLALFDCAALGLSGAFSGLDVGDELAQPGFEAHPLFLELDLLGRELLEPDDVALLLEVKSGDFVSQPARVPGRRRRRRPGPGARFPGTRATLARRRAMPPVWR